MIPLLPAPALGVRDRLCTLRAIRALTYGDVCARGRHEVRYSVPDNPFERPAYVLLCDGRELARFPLAYSRTRAALNPEAAQAALIGVLTSSGIGFTEADIDRGALYEPEPVYLFEDDYSDLCAAA